MVVALIRDGCRQTDDGKLELLVRPNTIYDTATTTTSGCAAVGGIQHTNLLIRQTMQPLPAMCTMERVRLLGSSQPANSSSNVDLERRCSISNERAETDCKTLDESIQLLRTTLHCPFSDQDVLPRASALDSFDNLDRKNPEMTMVRARRPCNAAKNRYQDVLPYDSTRVRVRNYHIMPSNNNETRKCFTLCRALVTPEHQQIDNDDDYINANYIRMPIPASGIVNHYIATQGPLASTTAVFWRMVMQEDTNLIVMLTQLSEQQRPKCHKYWPDCSSLNTNVGFECGSDLRITCQAEHNHDAYIERELLLVDLRSGEERHVTHLQYVAWPDHGVPTHDSIHFLDFVRIVRQRRNGSTAPMIIHCSAGIGRTGVLILMETAMCLIEANQPIRPLQIVQTMRNQRGMLIQTSGQYEFVLQCILRAYDEKLVVPSKDFAAVKSAPKLQKNDDDDEAMMTSSSKNSAALKSGFLEARDAASIPIYRAQMHDIHPETPKAAFMSECLRANESLHQEEEEEPPLTARCITTTMNKAPTSAATPTVNSQPQSSKEKPHHVRMFSYSSALNLSSSKTSDADNSERRRISTEDSGNSNNTNFSVSTNNDASYSDVCALELSTDSRCSSTSSSSSSRSSSNNSSAGELTSASDRASSRMSAKVPPPPPVPQLLPVAARNNSSRIRSGDDDDDDDEDDADGGFVIKVDVFERTTSWHRDRKGKKSSIFGGSHHRRASPTITPSNKLSTSTAANAYHRSRSTFEGNTRLDSSFCRNVVGAYNTNNDDSGVNDECAVDMIDDTPEGFCPQANISTSQQNGSSRRVFSAGVRANAADAEAGRFHYYYRAPPPLPRQPNNNNVDHEQQLGLKRQAQFRSSVQNYFERNNNNNNNTQQQHRSAPATAAVLAPAAATVQSNGKSSASASPSLLSLASAGKPPSPSVRRNKSKNVPARILSGGSANGRKNT